MEFLHFCAAITLLILKIIVQAKVTYLGIIRCASISCGNFSTNQNSENYNQLIRGNHVVIAPSNEAQKCSLLVRLLELSSCKIIVQGLEFLPLEGVILNISAPMTEIQNLYSTIKILHGAKYPLLPTFRAWTWIW